MDEEDEIFFDIGKIRSIYPYNQQDLYDRSLEDRKYKAAVLENNYLKAIFLPELGGRLWSLYDKISGRELLYLNDSIRFCNLALRNAWFSGGVEWNIGMIGHTPFTCEPLFTARLKASDGTPILRMYEYERLRGVTYQMDFSLPGNSQMLLCRMRICNLQNRTIPMYWWSNMAIREQKDVRVIVPADSSYYSTGNTISKTTVPIRKGRDVSYPVNTDSSMDYFYRIPDGKRNYIAAVDRTGQGMVQTSTRRLRGRKLFVWGQCQGGHTWQRFLTDKAGDYAEIQAGLGRTQYECIPMPPLSAWEWVEGYGALNANPSAVHGDWDTAQIEVENRLNEIATEKWFDDYLKSSLKDYTLKKGEVIQYGSGFGALESLRRLKSGEKFPDHLDFGKPDEKQQHWLQLLETGKLPSPNPKESPPSYMLDDKWFELLKESCKNDATNWYAHYHIGMFLIGRGDYLNAARSLETSWSIQPSCWISYGLAACCYADGDLENAVKHILDALKFNPDDVSLARDCFRFMYEADMFGEIQECYKNISVSLQQDGKLKFYLAVAYAKMGELEKAESLLYENGGLIIPVIREGEVSLTSLWFFIEEQKHIKRGEIFDANIQPPEFLDYRTAVKNET
ncbi:MAG: DUF5107 domain-containing protein [Oscillospiraceae bacterium]|nr:DUF5107 domain-containing protein [Oscillospiraceae bacterium]